MVTDILNLKIGSILDYFSGSNRVIFGSTGFGPKYNFWNLCFIFQVVMYYKV